MIRKLFKICLVLLLLLIGAFFGLWAVDQDIYLDYLKHRAVRAASSQGININWRKGTLSPNRLEITDFELFLPRYWVQGRANQLSISPQYLSLVQLSPVFLVHAQLYSGTLRLLLGRRILSAKSWLSGTGRDIRLWQHPQLAGLGLTAGTLGFRIHSSELNERGELSARGTIEIRGLEKPHATPLPPEALARLSSLLCSGNTPCLPLAEIPPIEQLSVSGAYNLRPDALSLADLLVETPLFRAEASGNAKLRAHLGVTEIEASASVTLSERGAETLGQLLPLLSGGSLPAGVNAFKVGVSGAPSRFKVSWTTR